MTYHATVYPHIEDQVLAVYQCLIYVLEEFFGIRVLDLHVQVGERAILELPSHTRAGGTVEGAGEQTSNRTPFQKTKYKPIRAGIESV